MGRNGPPPIMLRAREPRAPRPHPNHSQSLWSAAQQLPPLCGARKRHGASSFAFAVGDLIVCFSHPARPALGYPAVQVVSFLVWGCVLQRPLPCLDKTSSGLEMYLSIGNRQHFRWNSKDQRGLGMRRFASTRSGSATRSVLYYKNIYLCAIRFFRRYAILLSLVAPKGLRTR